jgi:hypothetical protein
MIIIENPRRTTAPTLAVDDVSFTASPGRFLGPNGVSHPGAPAFVYPRLPWVLSAARVCDRVVGVRPLDICSV